MQSINIKIILFVLVVLLLQGCSSSSVKSSPTTLTNNDTWYIFEDNKTNLRGFKDKDGNVKIKPIFGKLTNARKFDNIIAVMEHVSGYKYDEYYLTKSGKKVGKGNLYIFDYTPACENEGYIRFRDNNGVGLFNANGEVVIAGQYNILSEYKNGVFYTLRGAGTKRHGEHSSWVGGEEALIDMNNTILVKDFKRNNDLNLYSLEISDKPSKEKSRDSFKGVNGQYYSFINYEKEFKIWFFNKFMKSLKPDNLLKFT